MRRLFLSVLVLCVFAGDVQGGIVAKGAREIAEMIAERGSRKTLEELSESGGKKALREIIGKATRETGNDSVRKMLRHAGTAGISSLKKIGCSPALFYEALDALPEELAERAVRSLWRDPERIGRLVSRYGSKGLEVAAKFRGVGADIVEKLGDDGVRMAADIAEDHAVTLARHADDIAALPPESRNRVVDAIISAPVRVLDFLENRPRILHTGAGIATILALKDDLIGREEESSKRPDGSTTYRRLGLLDRVLGRFGTPLSSLILTVSLVLSAWGAVKVWGVYRRERIRIEAEERIHEDPYE